MDSTEFRDFEAESLQEAERELRRVAGGDVDASEAASTLAAIEPAMQIIQASATHRAANALERIADSLQELANPPVVRDHLPPDNVSF